MSWTLHAPVHAVTTGGAQRDATPAQCAPPGLVLHDIASPEEVLMRTTRNVAALSVALLLGACGRRQEQTAALSDDLKRDLAAASLAGSDLATAPQSYRRMRFVSEIEQSRAGVPAKRPK